MLKIIKNVANIMFICGIIFTLGVAGSSDLATMSFGKILLLGILCSYVSWLHYQLRH